MWNYNWLFNSDFIFEYTGEHREYLETLRKHIRFFIYSKPIQIKVAWNESSKQVRFLVDNIYEDFYINPYFSVWDFTHMVERVFLRSFFPMYQAKRKSSRPVNAYELKELIQKGVKANEAMALTVDDFIDESGIIDKIWLKQDTFQLIINGIKSIRSTAVPGNPQLIGEFLSNLKQIEDPEEIRDYVFDRSFEVVEVVNPQKVIEINYKDNRMLLNFFKENVYDLYDQPFFHTGDNWWEWGRYQIYFPDKQIRQQCQEVVSSFRKH